MTKEIETFLNDTFNSEKPSKELTNLTQAAATVQFWREDGVDLPDGIRAADVMEYAIKANQETEKPVLKVYKVNIFENHHATVWVEAYNANEAYDIFEAWADTDNGLSEISDRLKYGTEGFEYDFAVQDEDAWRGDIPYTEGKKLL